MRNEMQWDHCWLLIDSRTAPVVCGHSLSVRCACVCVCMCMCREVGVRVGVRWAAHPSHNMAQLCCVNSSFCCTHSSKHLNTSTKVEALSTCS